MTDVYFSDVVVCVCGQQNRLPETVGKGQVVICGRCKAPLDVECGDVDDDALCPTCGSTEGQYVPPGSGDAHCLHCGGLWPSEPDGQ